MNRPNPTCDSLGAYAVGALSATERTAMEHHIKACDSCQAELIVITPLPALLRRLPPPSLVESDANSTDSVQTRVLMGVNRLRRRRIQTRLALTAAAVIVAAVGVDLTHTSPQVASPTRLIALRGPAARGEADLEARPWGTQIVLQANGLPAGAQLTAEVVGPEGSHTVGSWRTPSDGHVLVDLATGVGPKAVLRLVVTKTNTHQIVLTN